MLWIIGLFLLFQVAYHVIVTIFWYGIQWIDPTLIAILRDGVRIFFVVLFALYYHKYWKVYVAHWWKVWLGFVVLVIFAILTSFFLFHRSPSDMLIGIKYGLWRMMILLTASGLGFFLGQKKQTLTSSFSWIKWSLVVIVILGRIWQVGKLLFPDVFFFLGYGKLDDFHFGVNPPIYYLTGFEGTLRWQGLFSWPNNYGYFLLLFLPLILYFFPLKKVSGVRTWLRVNQLSLLVILLRIGALLATLSRAAFVGLFVIGVISQFSFLKQHKKQMIAFGLLALFLLIGISVWKWDSTQAHLQAKRGGLIDVINAPLGFGLGSSGPAVHHWGNKLPENYYLQLMLDMGTIGFLIWCGVMALGLHEIKKLRLALLAQGKGNDESYQIFLALQKGLLAFLVMGMFLHVFEDSMVNYLFFSLYGMSLGYLSALVARDQEW